jgi:2',3'-cyclic-nucleotide 2'-phosphodiesterase (5'-nucleotidase family)
MEKGKPESLLGNFVADLCIYETNSYDMIDFCLLNNGGLRSSLNYGDITRGDIYKLMPFDNKMVIVKIFKDDILEIFNYFEKKGGQPISKLRVEIKNNKVVNHNLDLKKDTFHVLTSDYLANGGDNMTFFFDKEVENLNVMLRDLIIEHCKRKDTITSTLDQRIYDYE